MATVIYFSGPDGSGKTTSLKDSFTYLSSKNKKVFQLRSLQVLSLLLITYVKNRKKYDLFDHLRNAQLGAVGRVGYSSIKRDRGIGIQYNFRRYVGLIIAFIDILFFGRIAVAIISCVFDIVLVEEGPYEIFVKRHRPFFKKTALVMSKFIPTSDAIIYCISPGSIINRRKPELNIDEIDSYYRNMNITYASNSNLRVINLDTSSPDVAALKSKLDYIANI